MADFDINYGYTSSGGMSPEMLQLFGSGAGANVDNDPLTNNAGTQYTPGLQDQGAQGFDPLSADAFNLYGNVLGGVGNLVGAYTGLKNYGLAKDAFNFQKDSFNKNYAMEYGLAKERFNTRERTRAATAAATGQEYTPQDFDSLISGNSGAQSNTPARTLPNYGKQETRPVGA